MNQKLATNPGNYVYYIYIYIFCFLYYVIYIYTSPHLQCRTNMCFFFHSSFVFTNGQATPRRLRVPRFPTVFSESPAAKSCVFSSLARPKVLGIKKAGAHMSASKKLRCRVDALKCSSCWVESTQAQTSMDQFLVNFHGQKSHKGEKHPALETLRSCKRSVDVLTFRCVFLMAYENSTNRKDLVEKCRVRNPKS